MVPACDSCQKFLGLTTECDRCAINRRSDNAMKRALGKQNVPGCTCTYHFSCGVCLSRVGPTKEEDRG